jgi:alpha-N-arabinofuranosidase
VACLAQLVNAIAPIMTETGGPAWRQTIFWPFAHFSHFGRGRVLRARVDSPTYSTDYYDPRGDVEHRYALPAVPFLKLAVVHDESGGRLNLLAVNRCLDQPLDFELDARNFGVLAADAMLTLHDDDLEAVNTKDAPDRIRPVPLTGATVEAGKLRLTLPPASWNIVSMTESS